jgi:MFS superfamily sulfate permease-like transporter
VSDSRNRIQAFLVAVVLAGLLQIVFGLLKFGEIADYVPNSVIKECSPASA